MKPDTILEEVWNIKDRLAAEAGYDLRRFFEQLEAWSQDHPHQGPVFKNAGEFRQYSEQRQADEDALVLREEPKQKT